MQIYGRRWGSADITAGMDTVLMSWPIPADCVFNRLDFEIHATAVAAVNQDLAHIFAVQAWILQSETPGDFQAMNTLWDKFVPKDDNPQSLDNSLAADTDAFLEPGLTNMNQVFEQEIGGPRRVYSTRRILTLANMRPAAFVESAQTYIPSTVVKQSMNQKWRVQDDSGILIAGASPDMASMASANDDVITTVSGNSRDAFFTLAHLEDFVHLAMINLTNMTEAGAEEPYENLFSFISNELEKVQSVGSAAAWASTTYNAWYVGMGGLKTMDRVESQTLGPDAQAQ